MQTLARGATQQGDVAPCCFRVGTKLARRFRTAIQLAQHSTLPSVWCVRFTVVTKWRRRVLGWMEAWVGCTHALWRWDHTRCGHTHPPTHLRSFAKVLQQRTPAALRGFTELDHRTQRSDGRTSTDHLRLRTVVTRGRGATPTLHGFSALFGFASLIRLAGDVLKE